MPALERYLLGGVTLLTDPASGRVAFGFTERTGGVSQGEYASLNLGALCGDDPGRVRENRARALAAVGAAEVAGRLVSPRQVHGDAVTCVRSADPAELERARERAQAGSDAVVCTVAGVPVLMCFADCVPVVLTCPGGFAVVHSGWRGTLARVCRTAARALAREAGCEPCEISAYVGPHIGAADYEVSEELLGRFVDEFGPFAAASPRHLDLARCVRSALEEAGVPAASTVVCETSTASATDRFFSYRAEGGRCGRHAAVAVMGERPREWPRGARIEGEARS